MNPAFKLFLDIEKIWPKEDGPITLEELIRRSNKRTFPQHARLGGSQRGVPIWSAQEVSDHMLAVYGESHPSVIKKMISLGWPKPQLFDAVANAETRKKKGNDVDAALAAIKALHEQNRRDADAEATAQAEVRKKRKSRKRHVVIATKQAKP